MNSSEKMSDEEFKKKLSPEQYHVLREGGTEPPFTGKYYKTKEKGMYKCAACGRELFSSETKFDSGTGWPSFWSPAAPDSVKIRPDESLGIVRAEVICPKCGSHLGHVFDDGPAPTGQRYCINSSALEFDQKEKNKS